MQAYPVSGAPWSLHPLIMAKAATAAVVKSARFIWTPLDLVIRSQEIFGCGSLSWKHSRKKSLILQHRCWFRAYGLTRLSPGHRSTATSDGNPAAIPPVMLSDLVQGIENLYIASNNEFVGGARVDNLARQLAHALIARPFKRRQSDTIVKISHV
uniref:hypothetical protein n=1 Tax=Stutzerimonas stutzeri TaxID=316 RepID=UPI001F48BDF0|nr:hypothetical protein [Stutzerimonas stutzeri]